MYAWWRFLRIWCLRFFGFGFGSVVHLGCGVRGWIRSLRRLRLRGSVSGRISPRSTPLWSTARTYFLRGRMIRLRKSSMSSGLRRSSTSKAPMTDIPGPFSKAVWFWTRISMMSSRALPVSCGAPKLSINDLIAAAVSSSLFS